MTQPTSSTEATAPTGVRTLSAKESAFIFSIMAHNQAKLNVDWEAVAAECGYNSASTARVRFGQIKRQIVGGAGSSSTPSSSKSSAKRGRSGTSTAASKVTKSTKKSTPRSQINAETSVQRWEDDEELMDDYELVKKPTPLQLKFEEVRDEKGRKIKAEETGEDRNRGFENQDLIDLSSDGMDEE